MVSVIVYILIAVFIFLAVYKYNLSSAEGIVLLTILSFIKSCIVYLFSAGTIFNVFNIGSTQIHLDDIILFLFLVSCCNIVKTGIKRTFISLIIFLTVLPLFFSFVSGLINGNFPSTPFFNDIRNFVFMFISIYASFRAFRTTPNDVLFRIKRMIHILMNFIAIYVVAIWILDLIFEVRNLPAQLNGLLSDGGSTFRIIHPLQTIIVAFYTLWIINGDLLHFNKLRLRSIIFTVLIVLLQWRSVVAAFVVGLILVILKCLFINKIKFSKWLLLEIAAFLLMTIFILFYSSDGKISSMIINLFSSFSSIKENTGTFSTRTAVWQELLGSLTKFELVFGQPFGSGYKSEVSWGTVAHSAYVDYIMIMGIVGIALFLSLILYVIYKSFKYRLGILAIILISLLVFWFGYGFSFEQGIIIGFALAIVYQKQSRRKERFFENSNSVY